MALTIYFLATYVTKILKNPVYKYQLINYDPIVTI
jgi:hypothetical protein